LWYGDADGQYQLVDSIPASVGFNAMEYWFQRCGMHLDS